MCRSTGMPVAFSAVLIAVLITVPPGHSLAAEGTGTTRGTEIMKGTEAASGRVATAEKPAILQVSGGVKNAAALEVTARPISGDSPYLVGVFQPDPSGSGAPKLLGSFSFFPARAGVPQTFVLPNPDSMSAGKDVTLSVRLIPANPARDIKDAAVEILGARMVKE
jgi:hypothetical protein